MIWYDMKAGRGEDAMGTCFGWHTGYKVNRDTRELTMVMSNTEDKENTGEETKWRVNKNCVNRIQSDPN